MGKILFIGGQAMAPLNAGAVTALEPAGNMVVYRTVVTQNDAQKVTQEFAQEFADPADEFTGAILTSMKEMAFKQTDPLSKEKRAKTKDAVNVDSDLARQLSAQARDYNSTLVVPIELARELRATGKPVMAYERNPSRTLRSDLKDLRVDVIDSDQTPVEKLPIAFNTLAATPAGGRT